jgi:hypothetical protein
MLARHPLTGKEIRILSLDTSVWRDQKTLAWFDSLPAGSTWSRWDVGATSVAAAKALGDALKPDVVLCLDPFEDVAAWCEAGAWSKARVVAVPRAFIEFMGLEKLMKLRMGNLICLDEIHEMYPFVGAKWDGTQADAQVLLASILQVNRTFPVESSRPTNVKLEKVAPAPPQPLWLVTQYYTPEKPRRRAEIDACLAKNVACPLIDKIVLLNEKPCAPTNPKIEEHVVGKRLTYASVIRWIYDKAPKDVLIAFANADIFLEGDSWRPLWSTDLETVPKFLALLRWDVETAEGTADAKLFGPRADSQDTWVISSNAIKAVNWDWPALEFPFGKGGCDNSITIEMFKKRFLIANPALSLKTYHLHSSGVRGYNPSDIVDKPVYLYISPTGLHDKMPLMDLTFYAKAQPLEFKPFDRRIKGPLSQTQARTFCTMVSRATQGQVTLDVDSPNRWSAEPITLYRLKDVFQTRDGLAYTDKSILVGPSKASAKAWSESQISYLSASLPVEDAMIAPLPDSIAKVPARFILEYMSKIFLLRSTFGATGEFWCSKDQGCIDAIKAFSWPRQEIPVLSRDENQQAWCSNAAMWPYQDTPEGFISMEEIGALREAFGLGGWKNTPEKTLVIVVDQKWVTDEVAEGLEEGLSKSGLTVKVVWGGRTSLDASLRSLRGAWGVIMFEQSLAPWCWVLPKGAYLWDIQSEMEPSATLLHRASAAELDYRLTIVPKGSNEVEKRSLITKLVNAIQAEVMPKPIGPAPTHTPQLFIPSGHKGFYDHAGDSFREVARLWADRGYVDCVQSSCSQVWLHKIGDTLLYDRPNYDWNERAPPKEKIWRRALFGNPAPPSTLPPFMVSAWSFWPRRPALVEDAVAKGLPKRTWESREQSVVFYGRSENAVQKARRAGDWASACSEFVHMDGLTKYAYTQEEYLERLANSHYGLCLAGYGYKCHREIECMAMGCVPIVAPEVDMENYAEPPQEGLHYFRVKGPADINPLIKGITAERWTMMSLACRDWWQRNASVDGMWELTKRLSA